jgi:hypothetical protein
MPIQFNAGRGRLVQGDPATPKPRTDQKGNAIIGKDGTQLHEYFAGVAYPKGGAEWANIQSQLEAVATTDWGARLNPKIVRDFSWKYKDGDGVDKFGKPLAEKNPALAGHMILHASSQFAPQLYARQPLLPEGHPERATYQPGTAGALVQLDTTTAKQLFKRGYYVRPFVDVKDNGNMESPGIYVNLVGLELVEYGEEIVSTAGPSGEAMFGDPLPTAGAPAPIAPAPVVPPTASPTSAPLPPPHAGFMAPPPPAAPATPTLNAKGQAAAPGATYEAFISSGWTHDQLKANGYID